MTTGLTGVKHEGYTREHTRESTVSQKGDMITFGVSMVPLDVYVIPLDVYRASLGVLVDPRADNADGHIHRRALRFSGRVLAGRVSCRRRVRSGRLTRGFELVRDDTANEVRLGGSQCRHQVVELLLEVGRGGQNTSLVGTVDQMTSSCASRVGDNAER